MTQEEKQILLTDSYARLSFGFKLYRESDDCIITIKPNDISTFAHFLEYSENEDFKIYLRPMSSMTEGEKEEYGLFFRYGEHNWDNYTIADEVPLIIDWLNAHYFDYRDLIEKGLAIEAPEGMYKQYYKF